MDYFKKYWEYIMIGIIGLFYGIFFVAQGLYLTGALDRFINNMNTENSSGIESVFKVIYSLFAGPGSFFLYIFGYVAIALGCLIIALSIFVFLRSKIITGIFFFLLLITTYIIISNSLYEFKQSQIPFFISIVLGYISYISLVLKREKKDKKIKL